MDLKQMQDTLMTLGTIQEDEKARYSMPSKSHTFFDRALNVISFFICIAGQL
jgi:hypothetical protein